MSGDKKNQSKPAPPADTPTLAKDDGPAIVEGGEPGGYPTFTALGDGAKVQAFSLAAANQKVGVVELVPKDEKLPPLRVRNYWWRLHEPSLGSIIIVHPDGQVSWATQGDFKAKFK